MWLTRIHTEFYLHVDISSADPPAIKIVATVNPGNKLSCLPTLIRLNRTAMSNIPIIVQKNRREREDKTHQSVFNLNPVDIWIERKTACWFVRGIERRELI
mgnify:CR=1 FL=1